MMKTKVMVILADVESTVNRPDLEDIQDKTFKDIESVFTELGVTSNNSVWAYTISDFMDMCNNNFVNLATLWVAYVHIEREA